MRVPDSKFDLTLTLPQLSGPPPEVAARVNQMMAADQRAFAERMIPIARESWSRRPPDFSEPFQSGHGGVEVRKLTARVFSAFWTIGVSFAGAAHPTWFVFAFNFDLRDGTKITLPQLLQPLPEGLRVLAEQATRQLRATQEEPITPPQPTEQDLGHFAFGPAGLDITFDRGAVLAGAGGQPRITIPYAVLDAPSSGSIPQYGS